MQLHLRQPTKIILTTVHRQGTGFQSFLSEFPKELTMTSAMKNKGNDDSTASETSVSYDEEKSDSSSKGVSFTRLQIREYPIIVGDNPAIMTGCPITIAWDHVNVIDVSIDDFEATKPPRRQMAELRIPSKFRDEILKSLGFTSDEIKKAMRAANIIRGKRKSTNETTPELAKMQEKFESMKKGFNFKAKKREKKLLRQAKQ